MFICLNCDSTFTEPTAGKETYVPYGETSVLYDTEYNCPHCGSADYQEAKKCEYCGEYYIELDKSDE